MEPVQRSWTGSVMALSQPVGRAGVPSTPDPSVHRQPRRHCRPIQVATPGGSTGGGRYVDGAEPLGPTASVVLPSDNIPPPPSGEQYIPSSGEEYIPSSGEEYIYSPPLLVVQEGNTMALTPPVGQAGVPSTPLPSSQVDSLGLTASEALPSDNIPPPFFS